MDGVAEVAVVSGVGASTRAGQSFLAPLLQSRGTGSVCAVAANRRALSAAAPMPLPRSVHTTCIGHESTCRRESEVTVEH